MKRYVFGALCGLLLMLPFALPTQVDAATRTFSITAKQFSFSPSSITVEEGDTVKITLTSADVDHGFAIDALGVDKVIPAGKSTTVTFTVDSTGTYDFYSSVFAGPGTDDMTGEVVVKSSGSVSSDSGDTSASESGKEEAVEEETADSTAPSISGIRVDAGADGTATVSWATSEEATGQVEYGTSSGNYIAATPEATTLTTDHSSTLTGLSPETTYYYRIKSSDEAGNLARSSEASFESAGEEEDLCEDFTCADDEQCQVVDDEAQCVSVDEEELCAALECTDDETCEVEDGEAQCVVAEEGESAVEVLSVETDIDTYGATSDRIELTDGQAMTVSGTASPNADVALEFCCATTRYTVQADESGAWTFEGVPPLDVGDNYVKVYEKGSSDGAVTIDFEMVAEGASSADDVEDSGETIEEDTSSSSGGWVVGIIVAGLVIVVFAGFMFMKQVRR